MEDKKAQVEVVGPTEVPEEETGRATKGLLVDAGTVVMMVGSEKELRPMTVPQIFQEIFAILGDLDRRVQALETNNSESRLILPD